MKDVKVFKQALLQQKNDLEQRIEKIKSDKTCQKGPLEADSKEQAISLQNNEVIDGLDELERAELLRINEAIERIELGTFGVCTECDDEISEKRLKALPFARLCLNCTE